MRKYGWGAFARTQTASVGGPVSHALIFKIYQNTTIIFQHTLDKPYKTHPKHITRFVTLCFVHVPVVSVALLFTGSSHYSAHSSSICAQMYCIHHACTKRVALRLAVLCNNCFVVRISETTSSECKNGSFEAQKELQKCTLGHQN